MTPKTPKIPENPQNPEAPKTPKKTKRRTKVNSKVNSKIKLGKPGQVICLQCQKVMNSTGTTSAGNRSYICRKDRGGCGYRFTEGGGQHGGNRRRIHTDNAAKQKAWRLSQKNKLVEPPPEPTE